MSYFLSFLFPWLLLIWVVQLLARRRWTWPALLGLAVACGVVVLIPLRGNPIGRWLAGLNYQPGLPLLALVLDRIWKHSFQTEMLRSQDRMTGWIFGGIAGAVLYPLALGLGNFDSYSLGWSWSALFAIMAAITTILIWKGNRFGVVLLLAIAVWDLRWLESPNFWDYLVDPIYWLVGLVMVGRAAFSKRWAEMKRYERRCEPRSADL